MAAIAVVDQGAGWNLDDQVFAPAPEAIGAFAVCSSSGPPVSLVRQMGEVTVARRRPHDDAAAVASVAAIGAAARRVLLAPKAQAAVATRSPLNEQSNAIDEHGNAGRTTGQFCDAVDSFWATTGMTLIRRPSWSK
jgi:hypothetical protein